MTLLDDQIDAAEQALRTFQVLGRLAARRGKPATGWVERAMGMELVLKNLRFQQKHETAFRRLARDLIEAEQSPAVQRVLDVFPEAEIVQVLDLEQMTGAEDS